MMEGMKRFRTTWRGGPMIVTCERPSSAVLRPATTAELDGLPELPGQHAGDELLKRVVRDVDGVRGLVEFAKPTTYAFRPTTGCTIDDNAVMMRDYGVELVEPVRVLDGLYDARQLVWLLDAAGIKPGMSLRLRTLRASDVPANDFRELLIEGDGVLALLSGMHSVSPGRTLDG